MSCFQKSFYRTAARLVGVGALGVVAACGGVGSIAGGSSGATIDFSTIDQLPLATGPVTDDTSLNLAKSLRAGSKSVRLSTMNNDTWANSNSMAFCEMANRWRQTLRDAGTGDRILCYVQQVFADNQDLGIDIYDGTPRVFALQFVNSSASVAKSGEGTGAGEMHVQLEIERGTSGAIADFKMLACGSPDGGTEQQYVHQQISDGTFSMLAKGSSSSSEGSGSQQVNVSGTLSSSGSFVGSKTITTSYTWSSDEISSYGGGTAVQGASSVDYSGFEHTTLTGDFVGTNITQIVASAELFGGSTSVADYSIAALALGHGAARAIIAVDGSHRGTPAEHAYDGTQGWNGDTTMIDNETAASFVADVSAETPPAVTDAPVITFAADETLDCDNLPADAIPVTVDEAALATACADVELEGEWVNCYGAINPE